MTKLIASLTLLLLALPAQAVERFIEGEHYERLPVEVSTSTADGVVEVVEMFSYACNHCYNFDPAVEAWSSAIDEGVEFKRIPAVFNPVWQWLAQAYYTAEVLGVGEEMHMPLFEAIHKLGIDVRDPEKLAEVFETHAGVSAEDFNQTINSFSVRTKVQQADSKGRSYRITGVPTMVVNGKYRIDGRMAGSNSAMLEVVNFLVEEERRQAATAGP